MHTQAESDRSEGSRPMAALSAVTGLVLYGLTFLGEGMLGAGSRWLLAWPLAATVGAIVPLGVSAGQAAWLAALGPLVWSLVALVVPGRGRLWARRLGARSPSAEEALQIDDALGLLEGICPGLPEPPCLRVLDDPLPDAAVRGGALVLSRGLLETDSLAAVLAHELGHTNTLDGRLTEALDRLRLWGDPLVPPHVAEPGRKEVRVEEPARGGLLLGLARWALRLAGGGCAEALLRPLWAAYWRHREHTADAYAARLGLAEDLARHLGDYELPFDQPHRRLLFDRREHPPVARRIERLLAPEGGSK